MILSCLKHHILSEKMHSYHTPCNEGSFAKVATALAQAGFEDVPVILLGNVPIKGPHSEPLKRGPCPRGQRKEMVYCETDNESEDALLS
jgi:hypothetical protein